eukprot:3910358-Amphidinium_carterae.1
MEDVMQCVKLSQFHLMALPQFDELPYPTYLLNSVSGKELETFGKKPTGWQAKSESSIPTQMVATRASLLSRFARHSSRGLMLCDGFQFHKRGLRCHAGFLWDSCTEKKLLRTTTVQKFSNK